LAHVFCIQVERELGANLIAVGVGAIGHCSKNLGGCKCCCQDKVLAGDNYILVDSPSSSHVGPTIHLVPYCGCSSEKKRGNSSNKIRNPKSKPLKPDRKLPPNVAPNKGNE